MRCCKKSLALGCAIAPARSADFSLCNSIKENTRKLNLSLRVFFFMTCDRFRSMRE